MNSTSSREVRARFMASSNETMADPFKSAADFLTKRPLTIF
jgi:hypothetical protein